MCEYELLKRKYLLLCKGVDKIVEELKEEIYSERIPPTALRFMSDLKYYRYAAEKYAELPNKNSSKQGEQ